MKKTVLKMTLAIIFAMSYSSANAQSSLLGTLKNAASSAASSAVKDATGSSALGDIVGGLLGTSTVSQSSIQGTWKYSEPCLVAESKNVLSNVAASAAASKANSYLKEGFEKAGVKGGAMTVTFNQDNTCKFVVNGKAILGKYSVSGSDITVTILNKSFKLNCKLSSGNLQLALDASKVLPFITSLTSTSSNQTISTVSTLLKNVDGLYAGMKFTK